MRELLRRVLQRVPATPGGARSGVGTSAGPKASDGAARAAAPPDHYLSAALSAVLQPHIERLAVLVGRHDRGLEAVVRQLRPDLAVVTVDTTADASSLHVALSTHGPFDVILEDVQAAKRRGPLFRRAFWHLRDGGTYLMRNAEPGVGEQPDGVETVGSLVSRLAATSPDADAQPASRAATDEAELAAAVAAVEQQGPHLVVRRRTASWAKLREPEVDEVLAARRGRSGRVLRKIAAQHLESRSTVRESESFRAGRLLTAYDAPDLVLREYHDVVASEGQVLTSGHLLLPDSFRHVMRKRLGNRFLDDLAPRFARPRADLSATVDLPGSYYYLDSEFRGHFGHLLTEQVARFWGWDEAKRADPTLKALVCSNAGRDELAEFERVVLAAGGIPPDDVVLARTPVRVERMVAATPQFGNPAYVHPSILPVWRHLGENLAARAPDRDYPRRVFCSRRPVAQVPGAFDGPRRECRNGPEVERLLVAHGFDVVYPEDFTVPEQARMFREAEVVAGYAGSALFNLIFADRPKDVLLISSESYTAQNEYMIAAAVGHRLDVAWCRAEIPMPERWDSRAFNSPFGFDFDREGQFVEQVLADL